LRPDLQLANIPGDIPHHRPVPPVVSSMRPRPACEFEAADGAGCFFRLPEENFEATVRQFDFHPIPAPRTLVKVRGSVITAQKAPKAEMFVTATPELARPACSV